MGRRVKERGINVEGWGEAGRQETGRSERMSRLKSHIKYSAVNQLAGKKCMTKEGEKGGLTDSRWKRGGRSDSAHQRCYEDLQSPELLAHFGPAV